MKPLCFVLMPFGRKPDGTGRTIDFDAVYQDIIAPAVEDAGMEPIRADHEEIGGSIHKPMFERLMLCDYAVADVTSANPNVYYELGIRHALRPRSTVLIFAENTILPFDIAAQRGTPYHLNEQGNLTEIPGDRGLVAKSLRTAHEKEHDDSPLFQLIDDMPRLEVDHAKTDIFRDQVAVAEDYKAALAAARKQGIDAVRSVCNQPGLADLRNVAAGVIVDMMLSFRALGSRDGCAEMVALYERMPKAIQHTRLVREQLGFALNRIGDAKEAESVLSEIIAEYGPSSETNGLLGRVYKDLWEQAKTDGRRMEARGFLKRAIATYRAGFEADWRDPYPGINAVTLMEMTDPRDPAQKDLLPVVRYAARQRIKPEGGDYWDHATLLELAVLAEDIDEAEDEAAAALAVVREPWEPATTARNLRLIQTVRAERGEESEWIGDIEHALLEAEQRLKPGQ